MVKNLLPRLFYALVLLPSTLFIQNNCAEQAVDIQDVPIRRSRSEINAIINARFKNITCCDELLTSWSDGCSHIQFIHKNDANDIICPICKSIKLSAPCGLSCYLHCRDKSFFSCNLCEFIGKNKNSFVDHLRRNHLNEKLNDQTEQNNQSTTSQRARVVVTKTYKKTRNKKFPNHTLYKCSLGYICNPCNQPITQDLQSEHFW